MPKKIFNSFILAFHNIRSHFFHTMLSVLGIVIGVAALVAILSLIDGMEQYARDQITFTTSLKAIVIRPEANKQVNGISVRKDSISFFHYRDYESLQSALTFPTTGYLLSTLASEVTIKEDSFQTAALVTASIPLNPGDSIAQGRIFTRRELEQQSRVAVISLPFAKNVAGEKGISQLINKTIIMRDSEFKIIGIVSARRFTRSEIFYPITLLTEIELDKNPPTCLLEAENVEDVPKIKEQINGWLNKRFSSINDFSVVTNELRVEQAKKGFQLFRIIMGLIVGISVVVGGIGVMNVLLISVTERTVEIGIRKAVGANKQDIILQFLSESITISIFGSFTGLIFGILSTMIIIPVIKSLTGAPFQAAYTWNTLMIISILAVVVGVVFGTYPALRASRLDPVEAIRRE
jgi:putative ABC transport system permease protein